MKFFDSKAQNQEEKMHDNFITVNLSNWCFCFSDADGKTIRLRLKKLKILEASFIVIFERIVIYRIS